MSTPLRYFLFQIPGLVIAALVLVFLWEVELLSGRLAAGLWVAWAVKDILTYPLVRRAYEPGAHRHGGDALVGERATVVRPLAPDGFVRVRGELWRAQCASHAAAGDEVEIVAADAMRLTVRRVDGP